MEKNKLKDKPCKITTTLYKQPQLYTRSTKIARGFKCQFFFSNHPQEY